MVISNYKKHILNGDGFETHHVLILDNTAIFLPTQTPMKVSDFNRIQSVDISDISDALRKHGWKVQYSNSSERMRVVRLTGTIDVTIALKIPALLGEDYTRISQNIIEHVENENDYWHQEGIIPEDVEVTAETVHVEYPST